MLPCSPAAWAAPKAGTANSVADTATAPRPARPRRPAPPGPLSIATATRSWHRSPCSAPRGRAGQGARFGRCEDWTLGNSSTISIGRMGRVHKSEYAGSTDCSAPCQEQLARTCRRGAAYPACRGADSHFGFPPHTLFASIAGLPGAAPMHHPLPPLISAEQIHRRIGELAEQIAPAYRGEPLTIIGVLTGSLMFLSDLVRRLEVPLRIGFIQASSYRGTATS